MAMVVPCGSCEARFHLDEALLKGAKGARIRCRKCGGHIEVWNPGASPALPANEMPAPVVPPTPETVPSPPHEQAIPTVSAGIEAEPEFAPAAASAPEPVAASAPEPAAETAPEPITEAESEPVAAMRVPAGVEVPAEAPVEAQADVPSFNLLDAVPDAGPEPGSSREEHEAGVAALKRRFRASLSRGPFRLTILLVVPGILLLTGGAFVFRDTKLVRELVDRFFPPPGPAETASRAGSLNAGEKPAYDIRDLNSSHMQAINGVNLFVIRGTVANAGKGPSRGIRVQAALFGKDNQALVRNAVFGGNMVDHTTLRHASRAVIDGFLGVRYGEGNMNREIPAGKSLPFMVVFFDPPGQFESYTVEALDAE